MYNHVHVPQFFHSANVRLLHPALQSGVPDTSHRALEGWPHLVEVDSESHEEVEGPPLAAAGI